MQAVWLQSSQHPLLGPAASLGGASGGAAPRVWTPEEETFGFLSCLVSALESLHVYRDQEHQINTDESHVHVLNLKMVNSIFKIVFTIYQNSRQKTAQNIQLHEVL